MNMHKLTTITGLFLCLATGLSALAQTYEVVAFGIDEFDDECGGRDLNWSRDFAEYFNDAFHDKKDDGLWRQVSTFFDTGADGKDFTDSSKSVSGRDDNDNQGIDHADIAFISTHGNAGTTWVSFKMGDASDPTCTVFTSSHMLLGDGGDNGDLEVFIGASCNSGQEQAYANGAFDQVKTAGGNFHTWLGFHGLSYDTKTDRNRIEDYAADSFYNGLGSNWVEGLTRNSWWIDEQCATAVVYGDTTVDVACNYEYGGFRDLKKDGGNNDRCDFFAISGCDPADGPAL